MDGENKTRFINALSSLAHVRTFHKDTPLYLEHDKAQHVFIVYSGKVKINKVSKDGKELTLSIYHQDDFVSDPTILTGVKYYSTSAWMMETGQIGIVTKQDLKKLLEENGELAMFFMYTMEQRYQKAISKIRDLVLNGKKGALYSTLIRLTNSYGRSVAGGYQIVLPLTNQELGNFCGISRENVNRMLNELKKQNILSFDKGQITIHRLNTLRAAIDCEHCPIEVCQI